MLDIDTFLFPNNLEVTPTDIRKALFIGSCMTDFYVRKFREMKPDVQLDFILFNNVADMPAAPPSPVSDYDFHFIQIPLRHVIGDVIVNFAKFCDPETNKDIVENARNALLLMLDNALKYNKEHHALTFVQNFILPQTPVMAGLAARGTSLDFRTVVQSLNDMISDVIARHENVYLIDAEMIASSMGKRYFFDDVFSFYTHGAFFFDDWHIYEGGRIEEVPPIGTISPCHLDQFFAVIWRSIEYNYRSINQIDSVKLVIFDLDDTLWRGMIGENYGDDGKHPLTIGWPMGVHEAIHHLKARGILVAVCSKNSLEVVQSRWNRAIPHEWITLDDFVSTEISWEPKAASVGRIMADVNLTPRNVVFVDDNPVERASVMAAYPGIRTIGSNPYLTRLILLNAPETQPRTVTTESVMRDAMIRRQKVREADRQQMSREEFLQNLHCKVELEEIDSPDHEQFPRIYELLNKTNQFNTIGRRWKMRELRDRYKVGARVIAFRVEDKYTSYGLVGLIIVQGGKILHFVMSCRVLGLEIESSVLKMVVEHMRAGGRLGPIAATIVETDANMVCRDVYARAGFADEGMGRFVVRGTSLGKPSPHLDIRWKEPVEPDDREVQPAIYKDELKREEGPLNKAAPPAGNGEGQHLSVDQHIAQFDARIAWLESGLNDALTLLGRGPQRNGTPVRVGRWSAAGYPYLPRGQNVGVDGNLDPGDFLSTGWWGAEEWGVWGKDGNHRIRFHIPDHAGGYVDVRLALFGLAPAGRERPHVDITANGYFLGQFPLGGKAQTILLRLPPSSIEKGDVILDIQHSQPMSPASVGLSDDVRMLGAAFVGMIRP